MVYICAAGRSHGEDRSATPPGFSDIFGPDVALDARFSGRKSLDLLRTLGVKRLSAVP